RHKHGRVHGHGRADHSAGLQFRPGRARPDASRARSEHHARRKRRAGRQRRVRGAGRQHRRRRRDHRPRARHRAGVPGGRLRWPNPSRGRLPRCPLTPNPNALKEEEMTVTAAQAPISVAGAPSYRQPQRVTQLRVVRSEWTKLRTQPAVYWALLTAVILVVGFGIGYSLLRVSRPPHGAEIASFDPTAISLSGVQLADLAVGVLGVLLITSEYATGLIRTTFAAVPRRLPMLWG